MGRWEGRAELVERQQVRSRREERRSRQERGWAPRLGRRLVVGRRREVVKVPRRLLGHPHRVSRKDPSATGLQVEEEGRMGRLAWL